jgi:carbon-monoxide dehydrogenase medium subunit
MISDQTRFGFYEFNRRAGDFAIAMALVTYRLADGVIAEPRVGIGGAEGRPRRIPEAEAALKGCPLELKTFQAAAAAAAEAIDPMEDIQADAEYRRDLVRAMTRRALEQSAR